MLVANTIPIYYVRNQTEITSVLTNQQAWFIYYQILPYQPFNNVFFYFAQISEKPPLLSKCPRCTLKFSVKNRCETLVINIFFSKITEQTFSGLL